MKPYLGGLLIYFAFGCFSTLINFAFQPEFGVKKNVVVGFATTTVLALMGLACYWGFRLMGAPL